MAGFAGDFGGKLYLNWGLVHDSCILASLVAPQPAQSQPKASLCGLVQRK